MPEPITTTSASALPASAGRTEIWKSAIHSDCDVSMLTLLMGGAPGAVEDNRKRKRGFQSSAANGALA